MEPYDGQDAITIVNKLKPGDLPKDLVLALEQAVLDEARGGGILGYPLMKVRLTITGADYREGETTDVAVLAAATAAVRNALQKGGVVLLEPIMRVEIVTPDNFLGNVQADLQARRAMIVSQERRGAGLSTLEAHVPLSQMFGYSNQVRSLSQGRASFSMEPLRYDAAPPDVLEAMMG